MRIWRFADCEYDEAERRLWVGKKSAKLGDRVLDVLEALLKAPEHRCASLDLRRIWGPTGNLTSVKDAVRQLRAAMAGDRAAQNAAPRDEVLRTVRGWGFQLAGPVTERTFAPNDLWRLLRKDAPAPELPGWRLQMPLEPGARVRVWEVRNDAAHLVRVVKYATDPARRAALRREVRAWEAFERALPSQSHFVRILSSHLTTWPCFVEMEHGGLNLMAWADAQRAQGGLAREICLEVMAELAESVALAHGLGIIHNDLKPANVLISPAQGQGRRWQVKVADFGVASVAPKNRLAEFHLGDRTLQPAAAGAGGTSLYHAPQTGAGTIPTAEGDVYALGVILFQLLSGDFQKTPYPGWEREIGDPVLQRDIEAACNVDPIRRPNAALFAEWMRTVDSRREVLQEEMADRRRTEHDTQQLALLRARRPWVYAAAAVLVIGICTSLWLYGRTIRERDLAETINGFLADDLLTRTSPYKTGIRTESLVDAINQASPSIDQRFAHEPMIAARLHHTIAKGLDKRMDYPGADREYAKAAALYQQTEGLHSPDAVIAEMQRAAMHARDTEAGSLARARAIYDSQQMPAQVRPASQDVPVWIAYAQGLIQMYSGDAQDAALTFARGLRAADASAHFDQGMILTMQQLLAVSEIRLGEGDQAETLIRQMMETVKRLHYTDKPNIPNLGVNLAQAYMAEQKNAEAIREVDRVYPEIARQMGESNPLTLTALGVRAQAERNLGMWNEATRDSLTVYRVTASGTDVFLQSGSLSDAALYQCQSGHYAEGEENARKAIAVGKPIAVPGSGVEGSFLFSMATCLVGLGHFDQGAEMLARVNVPAVAQMYADADWVADVDLTKAEIALGKKDLLAARQRLAAAKPRCTKPGGAPYRLAWLQRLTGELAHAA